ncbi:MAG: hypothetical protein ACXADY_20010 [Candidatus Hodarchaeales archaeon]
MYVEKKPKSIGEMNIVQKWYRKFFYFSMFEIGNNRTYTFFFTGFIVFKAIDSFAFFQFVEFNVFITKVPRIWASLLMGIILVIILKIGSREINKFYVFNKESPFFNLFGVIVTEPKLQDPEKITRIHQEGHQVFKEILRCRFCKPLYKIVWLALILPMYTIGIYAAFFTDVGFNEATGVYTPMKDLSFFLIPSVIIGSIFYTIIPASLITFGMFALLSFAYTLRSLSKDENLVNNLTITHMDNLIDPTSLEYILTPLNEEGEELMIDPAFFEYYASFNLRAFRRNANPIARYALKTSLLLVFGLILLDLWMLFSFVGIRDTQTLSLALIVLFIANIMLVVTIFGSFLYPQLAIHEMLSLGKNRLVNRIEGIYQVLLASMLLKSRSGNFNDSTGLVTELNELQTAIHSIESMMTWPFNYREFFALLGSLLLAAVTVGLPLIQLLEI